MQIMRECDRGNSPLVGEDSLDAASMRYARSGRTEAQCPYSMSFADWPSGTRMLQKERVILKMAACLPDQAEDSSGTKP